MKRKWVNCPSRWGEFPVRPLSLLCACWTTALHLGITAICVLFIAACKSELAFTPDSSQANEKAEKAENTAEAMDTVVQGSQQYILSSKGVDDFGLDAVAGKAYLYFDEQNRPEGWIVEVLAEGRFVGATVKTTDSPMYTSVIFPHPQERFWNPSSDEALEQFSKNHPTAKRDRIKLMRDSAGHFWEVTGDSPAGICQYRLYTRYCP